MKKTRNKLKITGLLLTLVMMVNLLGNFSLTASAASGISYVEHSWNSSLLSETKATTEYTLLTSDMTTLSSGTYVVTENVTMEGSLAVSATVTAEGALAISGDVHLILCDGATLTVSGIQLNSGNSLTVYGQSNHPDQMGRLVSISQTSALPGIGGFKSDSGALTVYGGYITAESGKSFSPGIGCGAGSAYDSARVCGPVTVFGGLVYATAGNNSAGIGGGYNGNGGTVTVYGGTVIATGEYCGAAIGGGREGDGGSFTQYGGIVAAITDHSTISPVALPIGNGADSEVPGTITLHNGILYRYAEDFDPPGGGLIGTHYTIDHTVRLPESVSFTIDSGKTLTVAETGELTMLGTLVNNGTIVATGNVLVEGTLTNNGIIRCDPESDAHVMDADGLVYCCDYEPTLTPNEDGYYEITNASELFLFASRVNEDIQDVENDLGFVDAKAILMKDINLRSRPWIPIGAYFTGVSNNDNAFKGIFDGNHKTVTGLLVNATADDSGFFGEIRGATVKDLTIEGEIVIQANDVDYVGTIGAVCGEKDGSGAPTAEGQSLVSNVHSSVNIRIDSGVTVSSARYWGGIAGYTNQNPTIENCVWDGKINLAKVAVSGTGGLIGHIQGNAATVKNCASYGTVSYTGSASPAIGGLIGNVNAGSGTVENCVTTASAAIGSLSGATTVTNCYYLAESETDSLGGTTAKPASAFAGGEVAYLLGESWGQLEGKDLLPAFATDANRLYPCTKCDGVTTLYKNDPALHNQLLEHEFENGTCIHCELICTHSTFRDDGLCSVCDIGIQSPTQRADGTYEIANKGHLLWFVAYVNARHMLSDNGTPYDTSDDVCSDSAHAILTVDIDLNPGYTFLADGTVKKDGEPVTDGWLEWTPIKFYYGTFDGNGKTVRGLYINSSDSNIGFISYLEPSGILRNLEIRNAYVEGGVKIGGIVGDLYGGTVTGCYYHGTVQGDEDVGGVIGHSSYGTVTNCRFEGSVSGAQNVGGVIGNVLYGSVTDCSNMGAVRGINCVGGVIGYSSSAPISGCYNKGAVHGIDNYIGGVVGNCSTSSVSECYNEGTVIGSLYVGGIIGYGSSLTVTECYNQGKVEGTLRGGGIAAALLGSDMVSCLNVGNVSPSGLPGGLVSYVDNGSVTSSYFLMTDSINKDLFGLNSKDSNEGAAPKGLAELASGEIAYLLQAGLPIPDGEIEAPLLWGQSIGEDAYPSLGGERVYAGYLSCSERAAATYTNDSTISPDRLSHDMSDATCEDPSICQNGCGHTEGEALGHFDENRDHVCDRGCGAESMGEHTDSVTDQDHLCDYGCGAVLETCTPNEDDGDCTTDVNCSVCGSITTKGAEDHTDTDNNEKCDACGYQMSTTPNNPDNSNNIHGEQSDDKDELSGGAIAGIVTGSAAAVGLVGFSLFWFVIKKKKWSDLIGIFKK